MSWRTYICAAFVLCLGACAVDSGSESQDEAYPTGESGGADEEPATVEEATIPIGDKGKCGDVFRPSVGGGKAYWRLSCANSQITISGWVEDTDADGKCAVVTAHFADGTAATSPTACPKGTRKNFSWTKWGGIIDAYLSVK